MISLWCYHYATLIRKQLLLYRHCQNVPNFLLVLNNSNPWNWIKSWCICPCYRLWIRFVKTLETNTINREKSGICLGLHNTMLLFYLYFISQLYSPLIQLCTSLAFFKEDVLKLVSMWIASSSFFFSSSDKELEADDDAITAVHTTCSDHTQVISS